MKAGKYSLKELFVNRYVQAILIPEIQRDYVWGQDQVLGLLKSIVGDYEKYLSANAPVEIVNDKALESAFAEFYNKRKHSSNIGFIYAYNDEEYAGRYFLIDGQQRITTLYLTLLYLASNNPPLKDKFCKTYLIENKLKLDYKVRETSHDFLQKFVNHTLSNSGEVTDQIWFYNEYLSDVTIKNLIRNYEYIGGYFGKLTIDQEEFYKYLENLTEFWYFDTNVSEQGEELYIYMNARGEQMQGNENIKADLLAKLATTEEKNKYGKIWEDWQDFFWKHRGENENADKGFNEFLACIAGLERYISDNKDYYSKNKFDSLSSIQIADILEVLNLDTISKYFDAWSYLVNKKEEFKALFTYNSWVDMAINELWEKFNNDHINWFADYDDDNRATERNNMVYVWSVLLFIVQRKDSILQLKEVFRLVRIYYVRYNNNIRSVRNIKNEVKLQVDSGIWKETEFFDEKFKFNLFEKCDPAIREEIEMLIYEIEDHPYNIRGRDVGNINISHLVDFSKPITIEYLQHIREKFNHLFLDLNNTKHKLKNVLLHYGEYYDEVTPDYYLNLDLRDWRRIIRGIGTYLDGESNPFKEFFTEFLNFKGTLDQFLSIKNTHRVKKDQVKTIREMLLWYSQSLGEQMWSQGEYIAISKGNYCGLPDWENHDGTFVNSMKIYNTKGDLRGGDPQELFLLLN